MNAPLCKLRFCHFHGFTVQSLGMDQQFLPIIYWMCDNSFMLGLEWNHVDKRGTRAWWNATNVLTRSQRDSIHLTTRLIISTWLWIVSISSPWSFFQLHDNLCNMIIQAEPLFMTSQQWIIIVFLIPQSHWFVSVCNSATKLYHNEW